MFRSLARNIAKFIPYHSASEKTKKEKEKTAALDDFFCILVGFVRG